MAPVPAEVAGRVLAGNGLGRAVDAASVVWFLAFDVPRLPEAPPWLAEHMVSAREEAARRALG